MPTETVKQTELFRRLVNAAEFEIRQDEGKKTKTLRFPASSELPVERWYGEEILSHEKGAVRLARAEGGAMPLLFNHNIDDPIGMITSASIKSGRLWVEASLFEMPRSAEVLTMIEGGLRNVSIAYRTNEVTEEKQSGRFTATDWEPYEVSIVTVPADPSVGIGRGASSEYEVRMIRTQPAENPATTTRREAMPEEVKEAAGGTAVVEESKSVTAVEQEQRRIKAIETLCRMNKLDEKYRDMWVGKGLSVEAVSDEMLKVLEERSKYNPTSVAKIGLSEKESGGYSFLRAIQACATNTWAKIAPFELECSQEVAKRLGKVADPNRFFIPFEVLSRPLTAEQRSAIASRGRRDLSNDLPTGSAGGYLVETQNVGFIELLRNRSVAFRMGARRLSGLVGNVAIPRQSAAGTAYWLATQATATTESQQTFEQISLSPKTAAAYTEISRQLLLQSSPGAEGIVTDDLSQIVALAADLAVLNGAGSGGVPDGIIDLSGTGSVAAGSLNYGAVLEFQADVAGANVQPMAGGYVTTPAIASYGMQRVKFTSTASPLWEGNLWDGTMAGFRAMSSNQMPSATMIFGDWQEVVVAEWGVLEVEVNPYANFQAGIVGVRCLYSMDCAVRRPGAFSIMKTIS